MSSDTNLLPMVLTSYSMPHAMGYLPTQAGAPCPEPITEFALIGLAADAGLAGVEMPLSATDTASDDALRALLEAHNMRVVIDCMSLLSFDAETFRGYLRRSAAMGAKVVRAMISGLLCGDRRSLAGGWDAHLDAVAARLREALPIAEDLGLCIAMENHQDATTDDLLRLHEMVGYSTAYGITLDTGNPLAVGEDPVEAARRMAHLIRHVHCKDYTIHFAPEGYRLVRCAAGDGVIDFPAILEIVHNTEHAVFPGIEVAAQQTRTIPILEPSWWECYPPRPATDLLGALQILWRNGHPQGEPYSSAWERGKDSSAVRKEELALVERSIAYFKEISSCHASMDKESKEQSQYGID